jgi:hypothetical protein
VLRLCREAAACYGARRRARSSGVIRRCREAALLQSLSVAPLRRRETAACSRSIRLDAADELRGHDHAPGDAEPWGALPSRAGMLATPGTRQRGVEPDHVEHQIPHDSEFVEAKPWRGLGTDDSQECGGGFCALGAYGVAAGAAGLRRFSVALFRRAFPSQRTGSHSVTTASQCVKPGERSLPTSGTAGEATRCVPNSARGVARNEGSTMMGGEGC